MTDVDQSRGNDSKIPSWSSIAQLRFDYRNWATSKPYSRSKYDCNRLHCKVQWPWDLRTHHHGRWHLEDAPLQERLEKSDPIFSGCVQAYRIRRLDGGSHPIWDWSNARNKISRARAPSMANLPRVDRSSRNHASPMDHPKNILPSQITKKSSLAQPAIYDTLKSVIEQVEIASNVGNHDTVCQTILKPATKQLHPTNELVLIQDQTPQAQEK